MKYRVILGVALCGWIAGACQLPSAKGPAEEARTLTAEEEQLLQTNGGAQLVQDARVALGQAGGSDFFEMCLQPYALGLQAQTTEGEAALLERTKQFSLCSQACGGEGTLAELGAKYQPLCDQQRQVVVAQLEAATGAGAGAGAAPAAAQSSLIGRDSGEPALAIQAWGVALQAKQGAKVDLESVEDDMVTLTGACEEDIELFRHAASELDGFYESATKDSGRSDAVKLEEQDAGGYRVKKSWKVPLGTVWKGEVAGVLNGRVLLCGVGTGIGVDEAAADCAIAVCSTLKPVAP